MLPDKTLAQEPRLTRERKKRRSMGTQAQATEQITQRVLTRPTRRHIEGS